MELCTQGYNITTGDGVGQFCKETIQVNQNNYLLDILTHTCTTLIILFSVLGVATNVLNTVVYCQMGIRETVNITFIALSIWDLIACLCSCLTLICKFWETYFPLAAVNLLSVQYVYIGYTRGFMYDLSTIDTVYLTIERSVCIMIPFKVKDIFTTTRVCIINVIIVMFCVACFSPAWATQGLQWVFDPVFNMTRLSLWLSYNRRSISLFIDTFNGMVLPVLAQILIAVSAGVMIRGVKNSSKFRRQAANLTKIKDTFLTEQTTTSKTLPSSHQSKNNITLNKDLKVTKVVILLAMIFFVCNSSVFIVAFIRVLIPEIDVGGQQYQLYAQLYALVVLSGMVNATVNIVVYYTVSTKYRKEIVRLFRWAGTRRFTQD
ncbi:unnamed protein product [Candidula unifasciata]|uniref:G-protein coupled receptors family 1 profile domain-containing protein n=1 Tax=Candidula unifasciata TaxID=100452 RepID=A0A8S3ZSX8_9EUPU|nr:unnamed protein product [Candidula unifasciata]